MLNNIDAIGLFKIQQDIGCSHEEIWWLYRVYYKLDLSTIIPVISKNKTGKLDHCIIDLDNQYIHEANTERLFKCFEIPEIASSQMSVKDVNVYNISVWVNRYRDLFASSNHAIGDKKKTVESLELFLAMYPEYADIELILAATKMGIAELGSEDSKYIPKSSNFAYNVVNGTIECRLEQYCYKYLLQGSKTPTKFKHTEMC